MTRSINSGTLGPQDCSGDLCQFSSNPHTWTRGCSAYRNRDCQEEFAPGFSYFILSGLGQSRERTPDCLGKVRPQVLISLASDCAHVGTRQGFSLDVWPGLAALANMWQSPAGVGFLSLFSWKQRALLWKCIPSLLSLFQDCFFCWELRAKLWGKKGKNRDILQGRKQEIPTRSLPCSTGLETCSLLWTNVPVRTIIEDNVAA